MLQVRLAHERVAVQRLVECRIEGSSLARASTAPAAPIAMRSAAGEAAPADGRQVDGSATVGAQVQGPEQRQHDVRAGRYAPAGQRRPEILLVALDPCVCRDIEHAAEAEDRVHGEARRVLRRVPGLELQQAVAADHASPRLAKKLETP